MSVTMTMDTATLCAFAVTKMLKLAPCGQGFTFVVRDPQTFKTKEEALRWLADAGLDFLEPEPKGDEHGD